MRKKVIRRSTDLVMCVNIENVKIVNFEISNFEKSFLEAEKIIVEAGAPFVINNLTGTRIKTGNRLKIEKLLN